MTSSKKALSFANREVDKWVFFGKNKLGDNDVFIGGHGRHHPNISEISGRLVEFLSCCKRNGQGLFCDPFY